MDVFQVYTIIENTHKVYIQNTSSADIYIVQFTIHMSIPLLYSFRTNNFTIYNQSRKL